MLGRPSPGAATGGLYPNAERNIAAALDRALGKSRCKILLSIRPQPDFVESYYLQTVHQGGHQLFSEWVKGIDLDRLSWRPVVAALHAGFGPDRVQVIDFRIVKQGEEAFVRHALNRVDPTLAVPMGELPEARNRSISAQGLDMALAVNPHLKVPTERHALRRFLQKNFSNVAPHERCSSTRRRRPGCGSSTGRSTTSSWRDDERARRTHDRQDRSTREGLPMTDHDLTLHLTVPATGGVAVWQALADRRMHAVGVVPPGTTPSAGHRSGWPGPGWPGKPDRAGRRPAASTRRRAGGRRACGRWGPAVPGSCSTYAGRTG